MRVYRCTARGFRRGRRNRSSRYTQCSGKTSGFVLARGEGGSMKRELNRTWGSSPADINLQTVYSYDRGELRQVVQVSKEEKKRRNLQGLLLWWEM